ncbi:MAG: hypothetical protein JW891_10545 [Candidatus Lokiarchaeota archaeon]|nr:hypothetical protein [Candidatus Lokiarchaeota archaeon]
MNVSNYFSSNEKWQINNFSKDELLGVKQKLVDLKEKSTDKQEIDEFVEQSLFNQQILERFTRYLSYADELTRYLKQKNYRLPLTVLTGQLKDQIELILKSLSNLIQNARNIKRFLKDTSFIDELLKPSQIMSDKCKEMILELDTFKNYENPISSDDIELWIDINKIKDNNITLQGIPDTLKAWDEILEIKNYFESLTNIDNKKKKKGIVHSIRFSDLFDFLVTKSKEQKKIFANFVYLLREQDIIREFEDEFINVHLKKEITKALKDLIVPIFSKVVKEKLNVIVEETMDVDKLAPLGEDQQHLDARELLEQKLSAFLPHLASYYCTGLEKKYQDIINEVDDLNEFNNIIENYSSKIDIFISIINSIEGKVKILEYLLEPYKKITESLRKILTNLISELERRKSEYEYYLKTIKKERLRDNINSFVSDQIKKLNEYISEYEDQTSLLIREEFPQIKKMRKILGNCKENIQELKAEIHAKLDSVKNKDLDIHQIIKRWEDNYNKKKNQLNFLLSLMFTKIFKNFKEIIEEEESFFDNIADITNQDNSLDDLPLNFTLSSVVADKMTDEELKDRLTELKARISKNEKTIELYQKEMSKMEDILETRVKLREGITDSNVKCAVCHQLIKFGKENLIKCPFCESAYHYLCVASWLAKHNACPTCQNVFLDPNSNFFDVQEEEENSHI